jgi:hypothetical protein
MCLYSSTAQFPHPSPTQEVKPKQVLVMVRTVSCVFLLHLIPICCEFQLVFIYVYKNGCVYVLLYNHCLFSIHNARIIYTKKSKFVKNEHAQYTFQSYQR